MFRAVNFPCYKYRIYCSKITDEFPLNWSRVARQQSLIMWSIPTMPHSIRTRRAHIRIHVRPYARNAIRWIYFHFRMRKQCCNCRVIMMSWTLAFIVDMYTLRVLYNVTRFTLTMYIQRILYWIRWKHCFFFFLEIIDKCIQCMEFYWNCEFIFFLINSWVSNVSFVRLLRFSFAKYTLSCHRVCIKWNIKQLLFNWILLNLLE